MKASLFLAASGAVVAMAAGPVDKRSYEVDTVVNVVYTTVYADEADVSPHTMYEDGPHRYHAKPTSTDDCEEEATPEPKPVKKPVEYATRPKPMPIPYHHKSHGKPHSKPHASPSYDVNAQPSDFASTVVYHHNVHRQNHSSPAMEYDDEYAGYASQAADSCVFEHDLSPGGGGYGQNIAMYGATDISEMDAAKAAAQAITDMWYNSEVDLYPQSGYDGEPDMSDFEGWGHYSQMVWASSTKVGCCAKLCRAGTMFPDMAAWYTVCNYYPAGNMGGSYGENVKAPLGKAAITA